MAGSSTDLVEKHPEPPAEPTRQELVLQARERSQAAHAVLVVGFDGRPESLAALVTAAELGRRVAAELRVIHAIDLTDYPVDPEGEDWEDKGRELLQQEQETVARQLAHYEYSWSYVALHGDPVRALSRVGDESGALMIVVGSRGEGWHRVFERIASPSVSHRLIQCCGRPVLVVGHPHSRHRTDRRPPRA
jgi:nucleotide-binding universal stress UspA family protein